MAGHGESPSGVLQQSSSTQLSLSRHREQQQRGVERSRRSARFLRRARLLPDAVVPADDGGGGAGARSSALYQLRLRRLAWQFNMRLEERVNERTRVARDLHDTLLQSFHAVVLRLQAVTFLPPAEARQALENVIDDAGHAIVEARDAVQGLRSATVVSGDLPSLISALGEELIASQSDERAPALSVNVEGQPSGDRADRPRRDLPDCPRGAAQRVPTRRCEPDPSGDSLRATGTPGANPGRRERRRPGGGRPRRPRRTLWPGGHAGARGTDEGDADRLERARFRYGGGADDSGIRRVRQILHGAPVNVFERSRSNSDSKEWFRPGPFGALFAGGRRLPSRRGTLAASVLDFR